MKAYWHFFQRESSLLTYGLLLALLSSVGQTFLVSLFVPSFLRDFSLSGAGFGALYSGATLAGAFLLPWAGAWLDRIPLHRFTLGVVALLSVSAAVVAGAGQVAVLGAGLVGIRLAGQGLSSHTALTAMARYYERARGRAVSVSSLGYPLGEATLPLLVTGAIAVVGWRLTWLGLAVVAALVFAPLLVWLLRRSGIELDPRRLDEGRRGDASGDGSDPPPDTGPTDWRRREVLGDVRFWSVLPAALLTPFWATGLFLYQTTIAELKGWSLSLMASAFVAFALSRVLFTLLAGGGVDRISARRLFPFCVLPLGAGMALLLFLDGAWTPYAFMALLGVTMGASGSLQTALWAELYGIRYLGAIKSMMTSLMVVSTAAAPVLVGLALEDAGHLDGLLAAGVASVVLATLLALKVLPPARTSSASA